jgi:trans-2,3-dihydro-3-hydroxyanthranilate isomerase
MTGTYRFVLVDVFTDTPLTGNPLAVFPEADGLDDSTMQALAREFNFSETTFVVSPRDDRATRRLRSFSPVAEVFGAGHNALGAWWAIVAGGEVSLQRNGTVWQELGNRVLPVEVTFGSAGLSQIAMTQATPREAGAAPERASLARALSIDVDALLVPGLAPCVVSTGATTHLLVPVRCLADLTRVSVDAEKLISLVRPFGCEGCYCYCLERSGGGSLAHARGFFPGIGIAEDPATGSAAGPLGAHLVARGMAPADKWFTIEQGNEVGRRGRIDVRVSGERIDVGGGCVVVGSGTIALG